MGISTGTLSNKQLILKNVLMYTPSGKAIGLLPKESELRIILDEFAACISKLGISLVGPLIMKSTFMRGNTSRSKPVITYMQQVDVLIGIGNLEKPFVFEEDIFIPNCVRMQFSGKEKDFLYLFYKTMSLIKYENMQPSMEVYTFFISLNRESGDISAEVYVPVFNL